MITADFNIYDLVLGMRKQRPSLVQTKEQYELVYRTVKLLFERHLQSVDIGEMTVVSSSTGPDIKTSTWTSNQQIQSTSSKSSSRKEISYLSTKIPHHPRPKMYLS